MEMRRRSQARWTRLGEEVMRGRRAGRCDVKRAASLGLCGIMHEMMSSTTAAGGELDGAAAWEVGDGVCQWARESALSRRSKAPQPAAAAAAAAPALPEQNSSALHESSQFVGEHGGPSGIFLL
jgi:hypothetical protein